MLLFGCVGLWLIQILICVVGLWFLVSDVFVWFDTRRFCGFVSLAMCCWIFEKRFEVFDSLMFVTLEKILGLWTCDESLISAFNKLFESILFRFYLFLFPV